jgi:transcriptional regulator with XRE-family HTH domain
MAEISEAVKRLKEWRVRAGLTQKELGEAIGKAGIGISVRTIEQWESGRRGPSRLALGVVERFLAENGEIEEVERPVHAGAAMSKLSRRSVEEMKRMREAGWTLKEIGRKYQVDPAYVSRVCRGKQVVKTAA